jgi:DNA mismatch repair ATPase MutS
MAVKALTGQTDVRQLLTAKGLLTGDSKADLHSLTGWLNMEPSLYHRKGLRIGIGVLTLANLAALLYSFSSNNYTLLIIAIVLCRLLTGYFSKSVSRQHQLISNKQPIFEQYADILLIFSTADTGDSPVLQQLRTRSQEAHTAIRRLSRLTSFFDQRMNLLVNLILNSLAFYDLQCMVALERWKARYKADFAGWVEAVGQIECLNSLATFAFNHPDYSCPEPVVSDDLFIEAAELAHPLIPRGRRIANDFSIGRNEKLILVTGSNMSGKTTFLRTIGVNLLLAQCGAPVCASSFTFTPLQLLTSLRISDSLQEQTSYFMAELKKLQRIIHRLETGTPALVLIDEILRGTNSEDKTYGSEQFARKLVNYRCLSLFATHDLALGQLEQELPGQVVNYCFESIIEGGDLHFNYRLQKGIARNRNASFLMKKMKII